MAALASAPTIPVRIAHLPPLAPSFLPLPCPPGAGMSVMEMSHRGKEFQSIIDAAEADLRNLLAIPDNYAVIFMQARRGRSMARHSRQHSTAACTQC